MYSLINRMLLFSMFFLLISASSFSVDYTKLTNRIVDKYIKEIAISKGLTLTSRGGAMMCDVEGIILNFSSSETLTVDEARILYVDMMEALLSRMNQDKKIRPYLHNFPFETNNFELLISFKDSKRNRVGDGYVALIYLGKNNELSFRGYDLEKEEFYSICREPYTEALKIVQSEKR